ncbi:MAG: ATPase [Acidobacteria bacterium]|nr:MAG: ATPase [Acidobacteriota bacterium]
MQDYLTRQIENEIKESLKNFPVVAILGPRQCGKSTLAKKLISYFTSKIYLDLEKPSDLQKLEDPEFFLGLHSDKLVCLDEIQLKPDIFPVLRALIDENRKNGRFLILGSASRGLIKQSSESLAGRICYIELTPFFYKELQENKFQQSNFITDFWNRGGFPDSLAASSDKSSFVWRENFIRTFLERDIPQLGFHIPARTLQRLWTMLAHNQGQLLNSSKLGESLGVSHTTIRKYIDLLSQTFMVRILEPYEVNIKKRLIKSPKVYIRDSGILHALLSIESLEELFGHPVFGSSWEGFALENILSYYKQYSPYFYRTSSKTEIDLILTKGTKRIAVEFKASKSPSLSKGFYQALKDLEIKQAWVIAPVEESYQLRKGINISNIKDFLEEPAL